MHGSRTRARVRYHLEDLIRYVYAQQSSAASLPQRPAQPGRIPPQNGVAPGAMPRSACGALRAFAHEVLRVRLYESMSFHPGKPTGGGKRLARMNIFAVTLIPAYPCLFLRQGFQVFTSHTSEARDSWE